MSKSFSCDGVKWEYVKPLGKGAFGEVYLIKQSNDHSRQAVVKIIKSGDTAAEREFAQREVNTLKSLKHRNVVQYIGDYEEGGNLYLLMEFCNGRDLQALIDAREGTMNYFTEAELCAIFSQITDAFYFLHKKPGKHIIHRDVKCLNIFLCNESPSQPLSAMTCVAKVGDFGICTSVERTLSVTLTHCGTFPYMAPEVLKDGPYDIKADIWSLGVVLYQMAALELPFNVPNKVALIEKIVSDDPPPLPSHYSKALTDLIAGMLQKRAMSRFDIVKVSESDFVKQGYIERAKILLTKTSSANPYAALHAALDGPGEASAGVIAALAGMMPPAGLAECGWTPVHWAALMGRSDALHLIKGDLNAKGPYEGKTPLNHAAFNGHAEAVRVLLERGADPNIADNKGAAPLHTAALKGYIGVVTLLLDKGASINAKDANGRTPLRIANDNSKKEIAALLQSRGGVV